MYNSYSFENGHRVLAGLAYEQVLEASEIDGVLVFRIRYHVDSRSILERLAGRPVDMTDAFYFWDFNAAGGSYHYDQEDNTPPTAIDQFELTLAYPVVAGQSYTAFESTYTVIDTNRRVSVPAGDFTCLVYEITDRWDDTYRERFFVTPGVGLVVYESEFLENGTWQPEFRDELIRYNLNADAPAPQ